MMANDNVPNIKNIRLEVVINNTSEIVFVGEVVGDNVYGSKIEWVGKSVPNNMDRKVSCEPKTVYEQMDFISYYLEGCGIDGGYVTRVEVPE